MMDSPRWEVLEGLPAYGAMAVPFSDKGQGKHREGLVVRFFLPTGSWIGNFQRGRSSLDQVLRHPDGQHVVVVAGGTAYVVDVEGQRLVEHFDRIEQILLVPTSGVVLLGDGLSFVALGPTGTPWRSRRISWDGMRNVSLTETIVHGEAGTPDGKWYPFEIDATTGAVTGGCYPMPSSSGPKYWFHAKGYGWGWGLPSAWQGWVVLVAYLALVLGGIPFVHASGGSLAYIAYLAVLTVILLAICWLKGPPPRWR